MTACHFCGREFQNGDRQHALLLATDWGADDERDNDSKTALFHSFKCIADWAARLAADHDNHVVKSGNPDTPATQDTPVVDTTTDTLIRKD